MSSGLSRKRPAPGAAPVGFQQVQQPNNVYAQSMDQLSDDQFLQWSQATPSTNPYQEASAFPASSDGSAKYAANAQTAPSQLSRRPMSQMVARPRYDSVAPSQPWPEAAQSQAEGAWADDIQVLEQKAQMAKRDAQAKRKQIPPFVQKLNSFLENGKNTELIRWADDGNSFIVLDEDEFAKTLIPELFKHNNYASFVRQLNMYGFHKKVGLSDNSMRASERKNKSPSEYSNPYFRRGHPDLLWLIQKPKNATGAKKARKQGVDDNDDDVDDYLEDLGQPPPLVRPRPQLMLEHGDTTLSQEQFKSIQRELAAIRIQQAQISRMMAALKHEHEQLYGQAATFQDQHNRHENSINAILTFLATVYNRSIQGPDGAQGIQSLFANAIPSAANQGTVLGVADYPSMADLGSDPTSGKPFKRQPLLLTDGQRQPRISTASPASSCPPLLPQQGSRSSGPQQQTVPFTQPGIVEELFDSAANTPAVTTPATPSQHARTPGSDMMSVIQHANAQHGSTPSSQQDFSNVLSSLENAEGRTPLSTSERADMLRLMNNSAGSGSHGNNDNALINATPPSGPTDFDRALASTTADLDQLAKLQADQDRSVQNLTNLLQPLSPTGSIPGLGDGADVPPAPLDIDAFLKANHDYFNDFPGDPNYDSVAGGIAGDQKLDFGNYQDNDELFGDLPPVSSDSQQKLPADSVAMHSDGNDYGFAGQADGGGRVESLTSSEVTTPQSNGDDAQRSAKVKTQHPSSVDDDHELNVSDSKRIRWSIRAPCCRRWFDCPQCHAETQSHPLLKTAEMTLICKKCRKAFRKDVHDGEFDES
ncbi:hypothetical protein DV736_g4825, partial [Chaetothyriales sp. CBS 134916]